MTREDITKLAQEVGAPTGVMAMGRHDGVLFTPHELEHFVALVEARAAAAEREACAKVCEASASRLFGGKSRVNQVDRHTADVLRRQSEAIRARGCTQ